MSGDRYHIPWDQFVASLTLLQVPVMIEKKSGRRIHVTVFPCNEGALKAVLHGYKLYRAKREEALSYVYYSIDVSRFSGEFKQAPEVIYIGRTT